MCKRMDDQVAVAIVHFGDEAVTTRTVLSVLRGRTVPEHLLVINNGPEEWETSLPTGVQVVGPPRNRGYAGAVNQAACEAMSRGCSAVWILNNDVEVDREALERLLGAFESHPEADVIGSLVTSTRSGRIWFGGGSFNKFTGRAIHEMFNEPILGTADGDVIRTDWVNGCSMLIPLRAFAIRGQFDERFFLYKEELEWQVRQPPAEAWIVRSPLIAHAVGATTGTSEGRLGRMFMARNGLLLLRHARGWQRLTWSLAWVWDFLLKPALSRDVAALWSHCIGMFLVRAEPKTVLERK